MQYRAFLASSFAAVVIAYGGAAGAEEACGDATCPKGWVCESEPLPCAAIDCAEGEECPACEPGTSDVCRPGPCMSDAECDPGMRCFTEQQSVCTGGSAPCAKPDGGAPDCPEPEPTECTVRTVSACLPKYVAPCASASDCGEGFTCEPVEECNCAGSSGGGGSDGAAPEDAPDGGAFAPPDDAAPLPPAECGCRPTDTNHCVAVKTECTEASAAVDCPSGWTCEDNPEGVCFSGPDGSGCTPADPPKLCVPPFWDLGGGPTRGEDGNDEGSEPPASGGAGKAGNPAANEDGEMSSESGGCSVTRPASTSSGPFVGLALAALGLTLARRRRR